MPRKYNQICPCKGCIKRTEDCHEKDKCKSDGLTYHEWKADSEEIVVFSPNSLAKDRMIAKWQRERARRRERG